MYMGISICNHTGALAQRLVCCAGDLVKAPTMGSTLGQERVEDYSVLLHQHLCRLVKYLSHLCVHSMYRDQRLPQVLKDPVSHFDKRRPNGWWHRHAHITHNDCGYY